VAIENKHRKLSPGVGLTDRIEHRVIHGPRRVSRMRRDGRAGAVREGNGPEEGHELPLGGCGGGAETADTRFGGVPAQGTKIRPRALCVSVHYGGMLPALNAVATWILP